MLDMGGVAPVDVDTRINVGKNNKVMAVALDFHLITRSIEARRKFAEEETNRARSVVNNQKPTSVVSSTTVIPDVSLVEKMANLLNVNLGGDSTNIPKQQPEKVEDLAAIFGGGSSSSQGAKDNATNKSSIPKEKPGVDHMDIRSKYASKLRKKIDGGVAGLDLANSEKEDTMKRGDASIHMAARNLISQEGLGGENNTSSSRWLANTGVGKLLSFLSSRSMQIVLLPLPSTKSHPQSDEDVKRCNEEMESLTKQLPNVKFDLLIPDGRKRGQEQTELANDDTAQDVLQNVLSKIEDIPPIKFVVVSDRDDYLKAGRDNGMFTCRIRPKNKRRGDITTNYSVEDAADVQDVINEINGISYNAALKG